MAPPLILFFRCGCVCSVGCACAYVFPCWDRRQAKHSTPHTCVSVCMRLFVCAWDTSFSSSPSRHQAKQYAKLCDCYHRLGDHAGLTNLVNLVPRGMPAEPPSTLPLLLDLAQKLEAAGVHQVGRI